jgi:hypothetical protein
MCEACSTHWRDEKFIRNVMPKRQMRDTNLETELNGKIELKGILRN